MKKRLITIFAMLALVSFGLYQLYQNGFVGFAQAAAGILEVEYLGSPISGPIFNITNMLPGDCVERQVVVRNASSSSFGVSVKSANEVDNDNLAIQIDWEIKQGSNVLLSSLLSNYYADADGISLGDFSPSQQETFTFKACFKATAGNEYQNTQTSFDLVFTSTIGHNTELPPECSGLKESIKHFIVGTPNDDNINGTHQNDFIQGLGGNDKINSKSGHDCVVGGEGHDHVIAGSGADIVLGNSGNDKLHTDSGDDKVYGGTGNDDIDSGSGDDLVYGNEGNDNIDAKSGNDLVYGGTGNDLIKAGTGNDQVFGEEGNDELRGEPGNDLLNGGVDIDTLNGGNGTDTCTAGEALSACEL